MRSVDPHCTALLKRLTAQRSLIACLREVHLLPEPSHYKTHASYAKCESQELIGCKISGVIFDQIAHDCLRWDGVYAFPFHFSSSLSSLLCTTVEVFKNTRPCEFGVASKRSGTTTGDIADGLFKSDDLRAHDLERDMAEARVRNVCAAPVLSGVGGGIARNRVEGV